MNDHTPNALIHETSPYLQQHAYNPVYWYPWGKEALELAKTNDLPILVSIGYAACHWCHVMERESFEDKTVAAFMNEHFVNIKIDREERPDLDHFYMDAVQAISGSGGWPLNVFLTPDTKPFFGGTYYPPQKAFNRSSWMDVLRSMNDVFLTKRDEVEKQAEILVRHLQQAGDFVSAKSFELPHEASFFSKAACRQIADSILQVADRTDGGFGKAPKFLQTGCINYLFAYGHLADYEPAIEHASFTLTKMLHGGIYDQLGGGISRYSTDDQWLVPHFEKMLYDNALFVSALCDGAQLTGNKTFFDGIKSTLSFVMQELKNASGGYFTAFDADSEGVEGKFYVWTKKEIGDMLAPDAARSFCAYYGVTEAGNWEGHNILNITEDVQVIAERLGEPVQSLLTSLENSRSILLRERKKRIPPALDNKILLNCNALLLTAFCKAYAATGDNTYRSAAVDLFGFINTQLADEGEKGMLFHGFTVTGNGHPAFLDDYAYFVEALIHLQEITGDRTYLRRAAEIMQYVKEQFSDEHGRYFYYSDRRQEDIIVRKIELYDGATPSANAILAKNFLYLGTVFERQDWLEQGLGMLAAVNDAVQKYPTSFALWACSYLVQSFGVNELVLTGEHRDSLLKELLRNYIPNRVLQSSDDGYEGNFPLLKEKLKFSEPKIYLCKDRVCLQPLSNVTDTLKAIKKLTTK